MGMKLDELGEELVEVLPALFTADVLGVSDCANTAAGATPTASPVQRARL
jgi:hypothetical protein